MFETSKLIALKDDSKRHGESEFVERIGFDAWHTSSVIRNVPL